VNAYDPERSGPAVDYAFAILKKVSVDRTRWSIVYDVGNGRVHFRTRSHPGIRYLDLQAFEFDCGTPVKILDMERPEVGDVTNSFVDYSFEANHDLIRKTWRGTDFLKNTSDELLERVARYPESMVCGK
jgi:hypothetical protein